MNEIFIIAEIAQAHEGSLGIAHSYIDALAKTGVNAVKFQTHIAEAESSILEQFRVNFSYEDATRFDYWKRMEFSLEQWQSLKTHCEAVGLEFISSPFSVAAVALLEQLQVKQYKIGSGEVTNYLMLDAIGKTGKPIILSSGMSDWKELDETLNFLKQYSNSISLMQCTTAYPTLPDQWGLHEIQTMKDKYGLPVGYSDHSGNIIAPLAAASLGAQAIEFHAVFDQQMFGPDSQASIEMNKIATLVKGIRSIELALHSNSMKNDNSSFSSLKTMFGKSLAVNQDLKAGTILQLSHLESKKPGDAGIPAKAFFTVIGKTLKQDLKKWDFITVNAIEK